MPIWHRRPDTGNKATIFTVSTRNAHGRNGGSAHLARKRVLVKQRTEAAANSCKVGAAAVILQIVEPSTGAKGGVLVGER